METEGERVKALGERLRLEKPEVDSLIELVLDLRACWPGAEFKLFGSKARGVAEEESDLDILIVLPCEVTEEIRRQIIHKVFETNLAFETNISPLIMSESDWKSDLFSLLPIHAFIEGEGIAL